MPPTSDPVAPAPDTEFRYVGPEDVAQLVAEGWTATPAIPGSRDFAFLMQRHEQMQAALYLVGSVALSILALYAGMSVTRWLLT